MGSTGRQGGGYGRSLTGGGEGQRLRAETSVRGLVAEVKDGEAYGRRLRAEVKGGDVRAEAKGGEPVTGSAGQWHRGTIARLSAAMVGHAQNCLSCKKRTK